MREFISKLKENKIYSIGIGIVFLLLAALCLVLFMDLGRLVVNEPKIIDSKVKVVNEYKKLQDISDLSTRDELLTAIQSGKSDCYIVNDRYFAVLTTGGDSVSDIEYSIETNADAGTTVLWRLSDSVETESKVRYKIIEFDNEVSVENKIVPENIYGIDGAIKAIIIEDGDTKRIVTTEGKKSVISTINIMPGIYTIYFEDEQILDYKISDTIEVQNCIVRNKVIENVYNVELESGDMLKVAINDSNIKNDTQCTIKLKYVNGFMGTIY